MFWWNEYLDTSLKIESEKIDNGYKYKFYVPGIKKDEIKLNVYSNTLELKIKNDEYKYKISGDFDLEHITSKLELGILELDIPWKTGNKREIKIE